MHKAFGVSLAALLLTSSSALDAQANQAQPKLAADTLTGTISALLPSGATLKGKGATVYVWVDVPELRTTMEQACIAAHAKPDTWLEARTELASPGGMAGDTSAAADLALLHRIAAFPHGQTIADSTGSFVFARIPYGRYWIEAEMIQAGGIVQWWRQLPMEPIDFAMIQILDRSGKYSSPTAGMKKVSVDLSTKDFTHDQFCTGGEAMLGAAEFELGRRKHVMSSTPGDSAYTTVDQQAEPLDKFSLSPDYPAELRKQKVEGSVTARYVIDASGAIDMHTLRIVSATDSRFSNAVRDRLSSARFQPARIDGKPVRWVVEQEFDFSLR